MPDRKDISRTSQTDRGDILGTDDPNRAAKLLLRASIGILAVAGPGLWAAGQARNLFDSVFYSQDTAAMLAQPFQTDKSNLITGQFGHDTVVRVTLPSNSVNNSANMLSGGNYYDSAPTEDAKDIMAEISNPVAGDEVYLAAKDVNDQSAVDRVIP